MRGKYQAGIAFAEKSSRRLPFVGAWQPRLVSAAPALNVQLLSLQACYGTLSLGVGPAGRPRTF